LSTRGQDFCYLLRRLLEEDLIERFGNAEADEAVLEGEVREHGVLVLAAVVALGAGVDFINPFFGRNLRIKLIKGEIKYINISYILLL
jgi:hypothetical protein